MPDLNTVTFDTSEVLQELSKWAAGMSSWHDDPKGPYLRDIISDARAILAAPTPAAQSAGQKAVAWAALENGQIRMAIISEEGAQIAKNVGYVLRPLVYGDAAPVNGGERELGEVINERDHYQDMADKLADAIATHFGIEIGEHSNVNDPWRNALELLESSSIAAHATDAPQVGGDEHANRYRVEKASGGFWPNAVRCGTGTRELFVGHKKQCERVAAELKTAFEDGRFVERTAALTSPAKVGGDEREVFEACARRYQACRDSAIARGLFQTPDEYDEMVDSTLQKNGKEVLTWRGHNYGKKVAADGSLYRPTPMNVTEPVAWQVVCAAIQAVDDEASRRGEMFPQTSDEQAMDRKAVRRVAAMIEWYATQGGCMAESLPEWPKVAALSADGGDDKRDAQRYRWLAGRYTGWDREWMKCESSNDPGKEVIVFQIDAEFRVPMGRDITAAIDAAIAANQAKGDAQ